MSVLQTQPPVLPAALPGPAPLRQVARTRALDALPPLAVLAGLQALGPQLMQSTRLDLTAPAVAMVALASVVWLVSRLSWLVHAPTWMLMGAGAYVYALSFAAEAGSTAAGGTLRIIAAVLAAATIVHLVDRLWWSLPLAAIVVAGEAPRLVGGPGAGAGALERYTTIQVSGAGDETLLVLTLASIVVLSVACLLASSLALGAIRNVGAMLAVVAVWSLAAGSPWQPPLGLAIVAGFLAANGPLVWHDLVRVAMAGRSGPAPRPPAVPITQQ